MPFEIRQPRDLPHDDICRGDSEGLTQICIVRRIFERLKGKAAKNPRVLIFATDTGSEILLLHGIGDDDEMRGHLCCVSFGGTEHKIGEGALKRAERRAMNGMNNHWDTGACSGHSAENPRLSAVSVNYIRTLCAERSGESSQGTQVFPRMERTDKSWHNAQGLRCFAKNSFQCAFR